MVSLFLSSARISKWISTKSMARRMITDASIHISDRSRISMVFMISAPSLYSKPNSSDVPSIIFTFAAPCESERRLPLADLNCVLKYVTTERTAPKQMIATPIISRMLIIMGRIIPNKESNICFTLSFIYFAASEYQLMIA